MPIDYKQRNSKKLSAMCFYLSVFHLIHRNRYQFLLYTLFSHHHFCKFDAFLMISFFRAESSPQTQHNARSQKTQTKRRKPRPLSHRADIESIQHWLYFQTLQDVTVLQFCSCCNFLRHDYRTRPCELVWVDQHLLKHWNRDFSETFWQCEFRGANLEPELDERVLSCRFWSEATSCESMLALITAALSTF